MTRDQDSDRRRVTGDLQQSAFFEIFLIDVFATACVGVGVKVCESDGKTEDVEGEKMSGCESPQRLIWACVGSHGNRSGVI